MAWAGLGTHLDAALISPHCAPHPTLLAHPLACAVWDLLFFERSPAVLFRCALALVEIYERPLGSTRESSDAYMLLQ